MSFNVADTLRGGQTHTRMKDRERDGPHRLWELLTLALTNPRTRGTLQTSHLTSQEKLPKELSHGSSTDTEAESRST